MDRLDSRVSLHYARQGWVRLRKARRVKVRKIRRGKFRKARMGKIRLRKASLR